MPSKRITHPELEIGVIDIKLLKLILNDSATENEEGRIIREEGIPWEHVRQIRIEFLNILRIDHLWILNGLRKLSLSNNIIEHIENLETLVSLTELNLSYNKITKIENLDNLVNLEVLSLYGNKIQKLENFEKLEKLIVFSIGENLIDDINTVLYLRQFSNLKSVNLAGNPCCGTVRSFREWIAAFLPNITYYEYQMIYPEDKMAASFQYSAKINEVLESEKEMKTEKARVKAEEEEEARNIGSFVEFLGDDTLFNQILDEDVEGRLILTIPKPQIKEKHELFKNKFCTTSRCLYDLGQKMSKERQEEVDQFFKCVNGEKESTQSASQRTIEEVLESKKFFKNKMVVLTQSSDRNTHDENKEIRMEFNNLCNDKWSLLMELEINLHNQLEEVITDFIGIITGMIDDFLKEVSSCFTDLRESEKIYSKDIFGILSQLSKEARSGSLEIEKILRNPDNVVQSSHDYHLFQIDAREDRLISRAKAWLSNLVDNLLRDETDRNRNQILELNKFLDAQKAEFLTICPEGSFDSTVIRNTEISKN